MKKYKHKVTGQIVTEGKDGLYYSQHGGYTLQKWIFENSNDWEEVKEEPFIQQYGRVDRVKDPIETIISDKYPIKNMIKAKTYETLAQKLFISSIIYTATDGISIREGDKTTLYLLNKDDLSIVKPFYKVDIFNFSKQDAEVADRYLTFISEENRDKYIQENKKKPIFVSADGKEFFDEDEDISFFSVCPKSSWQENRYRLKDVIKFPKLAWLHFHTKEARQEYIDNNKPKYSLADVKKSLEDANLLLTPFGLESVVNELKKLGK